MFEICHELVVWGASRHACFKNSDFELALSCLLTRRPPAFQQTILGRQGLPFKRDHTEAGCTRRERPPARAATPRSCMSCWQK